MLHFGILVRNSGKFMLFSKDGWLISKLWIIQPSLRILLLALTSYHFCFPQTFLFCRISEVSSLLTCFQFFFFVSLESVEIVKKAPTYVTDWEYDVGLGICACLCARSFQLLRNFFFGLVPTWHAHYVVPSLDIGVMGDMHQPILIWQY